MYTDDLKLLGHILCCYNMYVLATNSGFVTKAKPIAM